MNIKSKIDRFRNESLAAIGMRVVETVYQSSVEEAKNGKLFQKLVEANAKYQDSIDPENSKILTEAIQAEYHKRVTLFSDTHIYVRGLMKSPEADISEAATLLFSTLNMFGKYFSRETIAEQSVRYVRIIEGLKKPECATALAKLKLTDRLTELENAQTKYESLYMGRGNRLSLNVPASSLKMEMKLALKKHLDELQFLADTLESEEMNSLFATIKQRFMEVHATPVGIKSSDEVGTPVIENAVN